MGNQVELDTVVAHVLSKHDLVTIASNVSNSCLPIQVLRPDLIDSLAAKASLGSVYAVVFVLGLAGNFWVLYGVIRKGNSFNGLKAAYVGNLSVANLLVTCFCLPISSVQIMLRNWIFGDFACKIIPCLQCTALFATSSMLTALAIVRYRRCRKVSVPQNIYELIPCKLGETVVIALTWALSGAFSFPYAYSLTVHKEPTICGSFCVEAWPTTSNRSVYGACVTVVQFLLPLAVNTACYLGVYKKLEAQYTKRSMHERLSIETQRRLETRRTRILKICLINVCSFVLAYLPVNILNLMRDFEAFKNTDNFKHFTVAFAVAHVTSMTSVVWNPFIYSFHNFRRQQSLVRRFRRRFSARTPPASVEQSELVVVTPLLQLPEFGRLPYAP